MNGALRFALSAVRRDWRSGELKVIALALLVAVAAVTSVGFFTDRVKRSMEGRGAELLAADLSVDSRDPIDSKYEQRARSLGLETAQLLTFPSVVLSDAGGTQLVSVKGIEGDYPLRGSLLLADSPYGEVTAVTGSPDAGMAWAEPRLFNALDLNIGDTVQLGESTFTLAKSIEFEPDRGNRLFQVAAPRFMINMADLESAGLLSAASRVRHRVLFAGEPPVIEKLQSWLEDNTVPGLDIDTASDSRPEFRAALDRATSYLGLASIVSVLVAGAAIAVAARRYSQRQADSSAIMRSLGASQRFVTQVFFWRLCLIAISASILGVVIGYLAQTVLVQLAETILGFTLPDATFQPLAAGILTGFTALMGFGLAPLLALRNVPVLRVLRQDLDAPPPTAWLVMGLAIGAIGLLVLWQAQNPTLAGIVTGLTLILLGILGAGAWGLVHLVRRLKASARSAWRYGLAGVARRPGASAVQMVAFGLGIMALLLLTVVRLEILGAWEQSIPDDAPNHFVINIQPEEVEDLKGDLAGGGIDTRGLFPMIRGRFIRLNTEEITEDSYQEARARRMVNREFNLSYGERLPEGNRIVSGEWWGDGETDAALWSVEEGLAERLGIAVGDELVFRVSGEEVRGKVASLRAVQWDSFQVNFFVIGTPALLADQPATFITSFHLPKKESDYAAGLVRKYPGVTLFDIDILMQQVRSLMAQASLAVQYVFVFTLLAGLVVLYAAVQASGSERMQEAAVLRALGAGRRRLVLAHFAEFIALGGLAGLLGAAAAASIGIALSREVFDLPYAIGPWVWVLGLLGGGFGIGLVGILATWKVANRPPLDSLRKV